MAQFWQYFPAQFHHRTLDEGDRASRTEWEAVVTQRITPQQMGQVRYRATWWLARCQREIMLEEGEVVYVVGRRNTTLWVEPRSL